MKGNKIFLSLFFTTCACIVTVVALPDKPGDDCDPITRPCLGTGLEQTECKKNEDGVYVCVCDAGLITDYVNKRCILPPEKPGDFCAPATPGAKCEFIQNTECSPGPGGLHICKCTGSLVTLPGKCLARPVNPGEECALQPTEATCVNVARTSCELRTANEYFCKCAGDLVTDVQGKTCLTKPLLPGQTCHPSLTPCEGVAQTSCKVNDQGNYMCTCDFGYATDPIGGRCLRIPTDPGDSCNLEFTPCSQVTNTTCSSDDGGANHYCKCMGDLVTDPGGKKCLEVPSKPGNLCHPVLTPCAGIDNTICAQDSPGLNFYCKCTVGFVNDFDLKRCLKIPNAPGQECLPIIAPCTGVARTECRAHEDKFMCTCNIGLVTDIENERCITHPLLPGDACVEDLAPCTLIPNTVCEIFPPHLQLCKCIPGFVTDLSGKRCLKIPNKPGQTCEPGFTDCDETSEPTQCESSQDGTHFCKCSGNDQVTDPTEETCLKIPQKPGDSCHAILTPCTGIQDTTCDLVEGVYICNCVDPLVTDPDNGLCLTKPSRPGDSCNPSLTPCQNVNNTDCRQYGPNNEYSCRCTGDLITDPDNGICLPIPQKPGDLCHPIEANCNDVPQTDCKNVNGDNICKCIDPLVTDPVNGLCLTIPTKPGQSCNPILTPCNEVGGTECAKNELNEFYCKCTGEYITDVKYERCILRPLLPGDPCELNLAPCTNVANTSCDIWPPEPAPLCTCDPEYVMDFAGKRCLLIPTKPGQSCEPEFTDCSTTTEETTCEMSEDGSYFCKCKGSDEVTDPSTGTCLKIPSKPGESCHVDLTPCNGITNTTCQQKPGSLDYMCTCIDPFVTDTVLGRCLTKPTLPGDHCDPAFTPCDDVQDTECLPHESEPDLTCRCKGDLITDPDKGICLTLPLKPGDLCHPTEAPCDEIRNTTCEDVNGDNICKCNDPLITDPVNGLCLAVPLNPGDSCDPLLTPCHGINLTECGRIGSGPYFCRCFPDLYMTDFKNKQCVRIPSKPGDQCVEIDQFDSCISVTNTTCVDDQDERGLYCKCIGDFITDVGRCILRPTSPGHPCNPDLAPCTNIPNTNCDTDDGDRGYYCKCRDGFFNDFTLNTCIPFPQKPGDQCDANNLEKSCDPVQNTVCTPIGPGLHLCKCAADYFEDDKECYLKPSRPLERCGEQAHCDIIPHTECVGSPFKICRCLNGYDPSQDTPPSRCIQKAEFVNDACETNIQCTLVPQTQCRFETSPEEGRCTCNPGTVSSEDRRKCLPLTVELGRNCTENIQCLAGIDENTFCEQQTLTCKCKEGWVPNSQMNKCLKTATIDGDCEVDAQCQAELGHPSFCNSAQRCVCKPDAGYLNSACHIKKPLFYNCDVEEECILGMNEHAFCTNLKVCDCLPGVHIWNRTCYADLRIGSLCLNNAECFVPVPFSQCVNNTCACEAWKSPSPDGKTCSMAVELHHGFTFLTALTLVMFQILFK